jgi:hypothetical protein
LSLACAFDQAKIPFEWLARSGRLAHHRHVMQQGIGRFDELYVLVP